MLTEREQKIMELLAKGMSNQTISKNLNISVHTTKAHLESIYDKLNVKNRVQAVIKSILLNLINVDEINL